MNESTIVTDMYLMMVFTIVCVMYIVYNMWHKE